MSCPPPPALAVAVSFSLSQRLVWWNRGEPLAGDSPEASADALLPSEKSVCMRCVCVCVCVGVDVGVWCVGGRNL